MGGRWLAGRARLLTERVGRAALVGLATGALLLAAAGEAAAQNDVSAGEGGTSTVTGDGVVTFTSTPEEVVTTEISASNTLAIADATGGAGNLSFTDQ